MCAPPCGPPLSCLVRSLVDASVASCCIIIPHIPVKVQQEIDEVTGSQRPPGILDRAQMPYTNAVVHEIQRVLDLAPVAHYHAVTKETRFQGFTIPKVQNLQGTDWYSPCIYGSLHPSQLLGQKTDEH